MIIDTCIECPRQDKYHCRFYSPILSKCDFPKPHNFEKEMEYLINHD